MARFPDFVCIGAMKCGTTALWRNLDQHPRITMCSNPEDPKENSTEIRFWNNGAPHRNWRKGIDWYRSLFHGDFCGEKCANYVQSRTAMKRMARYMPQVKLILCVRSPWQRAYSEYQMQLKTMPNIGRLRRGLKWYKYIERSRYVDQIEKNVLPFFPKESLHVVVQEWMMTRTDEEMNRLYEFLGLPPHHLPSMDVPPEKKDDDKTDGYRVWGSGYDPMDDRTRRRLVRRLWPATQRFFEFLGYEIEEWSASASEILS